jgi:hypothetical protein
MVFVIACVVGYLSLLPLVLFGLFRLQVGETALICASPYALISSGIQQQGSRLSSNPRELTLRVRLLDSQDGSTSYQLMTVARPLIWAS